MVITVIYLLMVKKSLNLKSKNLKLKQIGSISASANLSSSNIEDSKLYENVYDFIVDYSAISNDKIQDIDAYLMKKNDIV